MRYIAGSAPSGNPETRNCRSCSRFLRNVPIPYLLVDRLLLLPPWVVIEITGHKIEAMFLRQRIGSDRDLKAAAVRVPGKQPTRDQASLRPGRGFFAID
jgi:hypothetical protein